MEPKLISGIPTDSISESVSGPASIVLGSGLLGLFLYVVRELVKYSKHFGSFYMEENVKLRIRVDELEKEVATLQEERIELKGRVQELNGEVAITKRELQLSNASKERLQRRFEDLEKRFNAYVQAHGGAG